MDDAGLRSLGAHLPEVQSAQLLVGVRASMADGQEAKAAKQMEGLFATMLVKELRRSLPNGFFGKGSGAGVFEGWLDKHLGDVISSSGALNLAGMVKTGLGAQQAESSANGEGVQR